MWTNFGKIHPPRTPPRILSALAKVTRRGRKTYTTADDVLVVACDKEMCKFLAGKIKDDLRTK